MVSQCNFVLVLYLQSDSSGCGDLFLMSFGSSLRARLKLTTGIRWARNNGVYSDTDWQTVCHTTVHCDRAYFVRVQLLESPVFTYLRLQLLEPEKYPYLSKCLYGLLMLLPQTQAFHSLKNRLSTISPQVINTKSPVNISRSTKAPDIPWDSLMNRFRLLQHRHGRLAAKKNWSESLEERKMT